MSGTDETKSAAKSGRRNKKAEARLQKSVSTPSPAPAQMQTPDLQPAVNDPLEAVVAEAMIAETDVVQSEPPSPAEAPLPTEAASAEPSPVSLQTIANAYRDYTRKSFAEFGSFCERLGGVRSLDKAMEVQTEFVKQAYEYSVAESRKIRELHSKFARQTFEPFQGLVGKSPESHGKS